jgi:hypothetical protein
VAFKPQEAVKVVIIAAVGEEKEKKRGEKERDKKSELSVRLTYRIFDYISCRLSKMLQLETADSLDCRELSNRRKLSRSLLLQLLVKRRKKRGEKKKGTRRETTHIPHLRLYILSLVENVAT